MAKGLHPQVGTVRFAVHGMWVEWLSVRCRFVQLEGRVAEVKRGVDALRLSLTDCERTSSARC